AAALCLENAAAGPRAAALCLRKDCCAISNRFVPSCPWHFPRLLSRFVSTTSCLLVVQVSVCASLCHCVGLDCGAPLGQIGRDYCAGSLGGAAEGQRAQRRGCMNQ